ncbi:hypothetical protein LO762_02070 [Actinocorallia sp. API 0066]|uniref:hypothetical protein n=1 Tax=Actinocorallia sp. API 0066 TaxID=2896846 RepID=UPI001E382E84|nr:hypothetical protein [Actinocorallia sp. API 0066]MCD0447987.1 hypothetical protein [Actinocorallia sp. API 0066]
MRNVGCLVMIVIMGVVVWGGWNLFFSGKDDPEASDKPLKSNYDYVELCDPRGPKYFPEAAAYTEPGPHLIEVFSGRNSVRVDPPDGADRYPAVWNPRSEQLNDIQLVACLDVEEGERVGECTFTSPKTETFPLYRGIYNVTLYEAKTGKTVTTASDLKGKTEGGCPSMSFRRSTDNSGFTTPIDPAELRRTLAQHVE